ncbi:MAG TPA: hypothetical protein VLK33_19360, partial [Terriglobales bacterium]|nr:hypothetical protein [Terriglobales bacterium]
VLAGAVNGWQLSGYTTRQSGAPLQANNTINFTYAGGLTVPVVGITNGADQLPDNSILMPNGLRSNSVNQSTWFGTSQNGGGYASMIPQITCDPRKHASGLYFNPNCFATPAYGQLGTFNWPYIHAPAYFNSDLSISKNFKITENKQLQFRIQGTNFLNHSLRQFGLAGSSDSTINLQQNTTVQIPTSSISTGVCSDIGATANSSGSCDYVIHSISPTNTNSVTTGKPAFATGQRVLTFSAKFYF